MPLTETRLSAEDAKAIAQLVAGWPATSSYRHVAETLLWNLAGAQAERGELLEACIALQMEARARDCGLRIADEAIERAKGFVA